MRKNDIFEYFISGMEKGLQAQLRIWYNHQQMLDQYRNKQEREKLKREIKQEVLAEIQLSTDVEQAILDIKALNDEINKLGK